MEYLSPSPFFPQAIKMIHTPRFISLGTLFFIVTLVAGAPPIFSKHIGRHLLNTTVEVESGDSVGFELPSGQLIELPAAVSYKIHRTRHNHPKDVRQRPSSDFDGIVQRIMDKDKNQISDTDASITSTDDEWETNRLTLLTLVEQALNLMRITLSNAHHP